MTITTVGIDLAKNLFQVHGVDERDKAILKKQLRRDQMAAFFVNLPPCLIGMEACGSAHHWGRKMQSMGHTVRLMAPQFVSLSSCMRRASWRSGSPNPARGAPSTLSAISWLGWQSIEPI